MVGCAVGFRRFLGVFILATLGVALPACSAANQYRVQQVVDGDTLVLSSGDRVRFIGVDTPETKHPEVPVQRFGKEASAFTRKWLQGRIITLEFGPDPRDKYGRLLAYVWVDGVDFNRELIRRGYAFATTRFEHDRMDDFLRAEQEARARRYGMWHDSPTDGRVANLIRRWDGLSPEGKALLDAAWDDLLETHPAPSEVQ
jgi:micrococcal nuclease